MSGDDQNVGYGKPPKASQWKKGGPSPNPAGRPKKAKIERSVTPRQHRRDVLSVTEELVSVRNGDRILELPFHVANLLAIRNKAAQGHAPSQRFIAKLHAEAVATHEEAHPGFQYLEDKEAIETYGPFERGPIPLDKLRKLTRRI